ncbi:MAG: hybrid sensor histidine kinase/response regulator [Bacteroidales bacterium]|nr:hybrid sensor histidine kinase/response regulator [Bacteroidales bacterium]
MNKAVILCVDDESIILDALNEQLRRNLKDEYDIEVAESGDEALEVYADLIQDNIQVPVVISDYIMPGMKGDELLEKIHQSNPNTLTILLTGQANIDGVGNAINRAGLYRFITKPWDQNDLALTIVEAIKSYTQQRKIENHINELKDLNNSLEQKVTQRTSELEESNAMKDKFFSIIAHDLKNPFNYLIGITDILVNYMDTMEPEEVKDLLQKLKDSSITTFNLLQNLLDWSRSQRDAISVDKISVGIIDLVMESITPLLDLAMEKDIIISNTISTNTLVLADKYMINTVIRNLVGNAIKFTRSGGEIKLNAENKGDYLEISVSDNGLGIPEENLSKLFKIDENITTKGTNNEIGTGLGLILCLEFVEKHNGTIRVESIINKGSTFYFTLNIAPE